MKPARLICALLARNPALLSQAQPALSTRFGTIILHSDPIDWNFSSYYEPEMGKDLIRQWLLFEPSVNPADLALFKKETIAIEHHFLDAAGKRTVNIDPGILTLHNLVLATTKDYSHRICLDQGIYAEVTLVFHKGKYEPLNWTYPDYKTTTCQNFLLNARQTILPRALPELKKHNRRRVDPGAGV